MDILGKSIEIRDGVDGHLAFGPLEVWVRKFAGEWHVSHAIEPDHEDGPTLWEEGVAPEDRPWERWITGNQATSLVLRPLPPDRPVIVRPEMAVRLLPGQSTGFFVGLPLWVELSSGNLPEAPEKGANLKRIANLKASVRKNTRL